MNYKNEASVAKEAKQAMVKKESTDESSELTVPGKYYSPDTDIFETKDQLMVIMDMPGVALEGIDVNLDKDMLTVQGKVKLDEFKSFKPIYSEYNVGNYFRRFRISNKVDRDKISATMRDGTLTLLLPKIPEQGSRRIPIS